MKSIISTATLLLFTLASAGPLRREATSPGPYEISNFEASKGHRTGYCQYNFDVAAPALSEPVHCTAYLDAGFSGATWLANVYEGAGKCNNSAVSWTFSHPPNSNGIPDPATFEIAVNGVRGRYIVPATDITVRLNNEPDPFDNDIAYTGPKNFEIIEFP